MKLNRSLIVTLSALGVVGISACGGSKKKDETPDTSPTDPATTTTTTTTTTEVDRDITLAGSLNLIGGSSLSLAGGAVYDIYCVTFEDEPKSCKAAVDAEGKFNSVCEGFAGVSFGCFLRKDNKTVGDILFELGNEESGETASVTAGAGKMVVTVNFDPDLGTISGVVDVAASDALNTENVNAAKAGAGATDTTLPTLTGNYALEVLGILDDEGKTQPVPAGMKLGGGVPNTIHLNEYDEGGTRKVSIWQSESAKNLCLANGGSEQKPAFGAKVGDFDRVALNPTNLLTYRSSLGKVIGQFAKLHPESFEDLIDATGSQWEAKRCEQQEQNAQNASQSFNETSCKIVSPPNREVRYWDDKQKKEVVKTEPAWFNTWQEVSSAEAIADGNIQARTQTCFNPNVGKPSGDDAFIPPCPPDVTESLGTTPTGTFTAYDYVSGDVRRPLQFVCKNPQDQNGGLMFFPVTAPASDTAAENEYLEASIADVKTKFSQGGGADAGCEKISVSTMFDENGSLGLSDVTEVDFDNKMVFKSSRRVILQTFSEILRESGNNEGEGGYDRCSEWKKPSANEMANFNFNTSCQGGRGGPICWGSQWTLQSIGVKFATSGTAFEQLPAEQNQDKPFLPPEVAKLCPTFAAATPDFAKDQPNQGETFDQFKARKSGYRNSCSTEFLGLSFAAAVEKLYEGVLDPSKQPPSVVLSCSEDTATKDAIASIAQSSCMPELQLDFRCEGGKDCTEVLRCWGTEDGNCVDASGSFVGRVPNRFETTSLKLGTQGAFNLSSLTKESWKQWSEKGEKVCRAARGFKIAGSKKADAPFTFEGSLNSTSTQKCDGDTEESEGSDKDKGPDRLFIKFTKQ